MTAPPSPQPSPAQAGEGGLYENVTARLAQFIVESSWNDIPQSLRREAKRSILNHIGCALGSCRDEV
ncbi:MAG: hypothetical protein HYY77_16805, partial [Betaproteobacteria bacterium]|nr:hypothetical protein [Betaproteobacteria bacterium]